jgi:hypothetical protein
MAVQRRANARRFVDAVGKAFRSERGVSRAAVGLLRIAAIISVAALGLFHVRLFWERLAEGQLLDPAVALRWGGAALLVMGLAVLSRRGTPLFRGRRAVVVWTLVALLHWSTGRFTPAFDPASSDQVPAVAVLVPTLAGAALVGLGLTSVLASRRDVVRFVAIGVVVDPSFQALLPGWCQTTATRGPPVSAF